MVGDIIKVMDDEIVPADCFLLTSGVGADDPDANGQCFIATSSLDGERNLKPKMAIKEIETDFLNLISNRGEDVMMELKCTDEPFPDLYSFDANLKICNKRCQKNFDLDLRQFIPRGCHVRNSQCLYLMVIYTGPETKLILN